MTSAGDLRESVVFSCKPFASDGYGNAEGDFVAQFTERARIRPRLGGEQVMASRLQGRNLATITVRYSSATAQITTDWRATDARTGDIWNIRSVENPDERRHFLELLCEKGVAV